MVYNNKVAIEEQWQTTYENDLTARRVTFVEGGGLIDSNEGKYINTKDLESVELLGEIFKQLKIMNLHLSILTDNDIKKTEIE